MSARAVRSLAVAAGLALILAAISIPVWLAIPGIGWRQATDILWDNRYAAWTYAGLMSLSAALFAPVGLLFAVRLYRRHPGAALTGGTLQLLGLILLALGALFGTLRFGPFMQPAPAQMGGLIATALGGEVSALLLLQTLGSALSLSSSVGTGLVLVGLTLLSLAARGRQVLPLLLVLLAVILLLVALFVPAVYMTFTMAASLLVLGLAYIAIGFATARLNNRVEIDPVTGREVVGQTPPARRSKRARRR